MGVLSRELEIVQNPALGAVLLWRFSVGFDRGRLDRSPIPLPMMFVVLPMLLHEGVSEFVASTQEQSGLRTFADKFLQSRASSSDELLAIHDRAQEMRELTLQSVRVAIACQLILVYPNDASASALTQTFPTSAVPASIRPLLRSAEKLGVWCGRLTFHEVATTLKVSF